MAESLQLKAGEIAALPIARRPNYRVNYIPSNTWKTPMFLFQPETLDFKNGVKLTCLKAKEGEKIRGLTIDLPIVD